MSRVAFKLSVPVFFVVVLLAVSQLAQASFGFGWIGAAFLAFLAADLFVGFVHFLADNFGRLDSPFGRTFLLRFRHHHKEPGELVEEPLSEVVGPSLLFTVPVLVLALLIAPSPLFLWFALVFTVVGGWANLVHRWAHLECPPFPVRFLQQAGVLMDAEQHQKHHDIPNTHYCVIAGWFDDYVLRKGWPDKVRAYLADLGLPQG